MSVDDHPTIVVNKGNASIVISEKQPVEASEGPINIQNPLSRYMRIKSQIGREFLAEILGSFILLAFGLASVAQFKFSKKEDPYQTSFISVNFAFGFGVTCAIIVVGKVSGAHLNPAVSFAMLITGRMTFLRFIIYTIGQFLGSFFGALLVYLVYLDGLKKYEGGMNSLDTAGIFATYPNTKLSVFGGFFDQVIGTALLVLVVMALSDKKNAEIPHGVAAILVGFTITVIGLAFGYNCGYAVNPTRDFAPRLFTLIAGWGGQVFSANNYFFWVPIVGPMVGSVVAVFIYSIFISNNW